MRKFSFSNKAKPLFWANNHFSIKHSSEAGCCWCRLRIGQEDAVEEREGWQEKTLRHRENKTYFDSGHKNSLFKYEARFPGVNSQFWWLIPLFWGKLCDVLSPKLEEPTSLKFYIRTAFIDIMTHAKFQFSQLMLTLIFGILASEPHPPPPLPTLGPGKRLKRPGVIGLTSDSSPCWLWVPIPRSTFLRYIDGWFDIDVSLRERVSNRERSRESRLLALRYQLSFSGLRIESLFQRHNFKITDLVLRTPGNSRTKVVTFFLFHFNKNRFHKQLDDTRTPVKPMSTQDLNQRQARIRVNRWDSNLPCLKTWWAVFLHPYPGNHSATLSI